MAKFCANGHQMEDSWEMCPYCQKTGFVGAAGIPGKTRVEVPTPQSATVSPSRKTVVVSDLHKAPLVGWVVLMDGNDKGKDFRVRDGQNMMGSDPACDIVIVHPTISGRHASLRAKEGKFFLTDLDSTNGTYLNQEQKSISREEIKDNDQIRLGEVTLKFKCL
jgi:Inner membrane component of T3SS, cytoplasmic domain